MAYQFRPAVRSRSTLLWALAAFTAAAAAPADAGAAQFHGITVRDSSTGTPLGCATLKTTGAISYTSDDNGKVAFYEPGLMGKSVYLGAERDGYCFERTGFCFEGKAFTAAEGGTTFFDAVPVPPSGICPAPCCTANCPGLLCPARCMPDPDPGVCSAGDDATQLLAGPVPTPSERFRITVVDEATGRGVPLVAVVSPKASEWTDSAGVVAFHDPDLMGQAVFFTIGGHGYELVDPMGLGGVTLTTTPGASGQITVRRAAVQVAERLYRITGGGSYRESVLMGDPTPTANPVINGLVIGQDTVQSTVYQGKAFYFWGDTSKPSGPLGNFKASGATSLLPGAGGLDPNVGIDLTYFVDGTGFSKQMCPSSTVPNPPGITDFLACWLGGLVVLPNGSGQDRLFSRYALVLSLGDTKERGLVRFNDTTQVFEKVLVLGADDVAKLTSHPFKWSHGAANYAYYPETTRVPAAEAALLDPATYQVYTGLVAGTTNQIERDGQGRIVYGWKTGTPAITQALVDQGLLTQSEALFGHIVEPATGEKPLVSTTSIAWNDHRRRFTRVLQQVFGATSFLGEAWYLEGDTPMGPWVYARKIITHDNYSFYQIRHHPFLDRQGGREIFVDATYTASFSGSAPTPRHNYNQFMYKLDLEREEVVLPVPVYDLSAGTTPGDVVTKNGLRPGTAPPPAPFMAWDRPAPGAVPVSWSDAKCMPRALVVGGSPVYDPVFYALPANAPSPPAETVPLYDYVNASTGAHAYSIDPSLSLPGFSLVGPLVLVWRNPLTVTLPSTEYLVPLVADAGADQCVTETFEGTGAAVTLDGTASSHAGGTIADYQWKQLNGTLTASGATAQMTLPAGLHRVELTTTDTAGGKSVDVVTVNVAVGPPCNPIASTASPSSARWALALAPLAVFGLLAIAMRRRVGSV